MSNLRFFYQLPQISSNYIIANSSLHSNTGGNNNSQVDSQLGNNSIQNGHHEDIKIKSPFYERQNHPKGNCQCPYHRMKRYKQIAQANRHSPNFKMKDELDLYKSRIAAAVKQASQMSKYNKEDTNFYLHKRAFRNTEGQSKKYTQNNKQFRRPRQQLDNYNELFEQILKMRMLPLQDHQKVSNLLKFIKMKGLMDKKYLHKQRDYIQLHLMRVVQKIKFDQILQITDKDVDLISKIAKLLNVKPDNALNFIKAIQTAAKDLEFYILQKVKEKQISDQSFNKIQNKHKNNRKDYNDEISINSNGKQNQNYLLNKSIHGLVSHENFQQNQNINNRFSPLQIKLHGLKGNQQQNDSFQIKSLTSTERKKMLNNIKMSMRRSKDFGNGQNQYNNENQRDKNNMTGAQTYSRFHQEAINKTNNIKLDNENSKNQDLMHKNYSESKKSFMRLSKLIGYHKQNQFKENIEQQEEQLSKQFYDNNINNNKGEKGKKAKLHNKRKDIQKAPINPFDSLIYAPIVSKQQFERIKYIVSDKGGTNEEIKMKKVFMLIQKRLSQNAQFFQQFIQKFAPALSQQQIDILKQKFKKHEHQRMIAKLTKQVDACLMELKHSEDMIWKDEQDEDAGRQREREGKKRTLQLQCMNQNEGLLDQFNKFTIIQKIPVLKNSIQSKSEWQLEQKDIGQIQLESQVFIAPKHKQKYKDEQKSKKKQGIKSQVFENKSDVIDRAKHKQILKYMKNRHEDMFKQISCNIKDTLSNIDCVEERAHSIHS